MECNKEEAIRAKETAEKKMQNGDFQGAKRIGMKAQRLYPDLDNIAQLLMVCDVLCSAEKKLYGSEMDWYGILQIGRFSNESIIKKQFRKLALFLHPDKNKFPGADAAFKLIGDANRVLMDPSKRSIYDMKCGGSSIPTKPKPNHSNQNTFNKNQESVFWTCCSACNMWYEYLRKYEKQTLKCQSCSQPFVAHDLGTPPDSASGQTVNGKRVSNQGSSKNMGSKSPGMPSGVMFTKVVFNSMPPGKAADSTETFKSKEEVKMETGSKTGGDGHKFKRKSPRKKSRVSHKEKLSDDDDGDDFVVPPPKRSKEKTEVEKSSGNGDEKEINNGPSRRKRKTRENDDKVEEAIMSEKASTNLENNDGKSEISKEKSDIYVYPVSNFSNFERGREKSSFAANQVWAVYDKLDSMPRFYAKIKKVIIPGFKLLITWLDRSPINEAEKKWSDSGLPIACGRFQNGDTEEVEDNLMFSHVMPNMNSGINGFYFVYPNKGETWAIFKNWDLEKWSEEPGEHLPPYEFDFVEILTDFNVDVGIGVAYLGKVKGFISIFQPAARNEILAFTIKPGELYKFSHQIPSFKLSGKEGEGIPIGSYELDTASLPINFRKLGDTSEISSPKNLEKWTSSNNEKLPIRRKKLETNKIIEETFTPRRSPRDFKRVRSRYTTEINKHAKRTKDNSPTKPPSSSCEPEDKMDLHVKDACEPEDKMDLHVKDEKLGNSRKASNSRVIEVEPYDFKTEKSEDKFEVDQIWALHSDEDGLPRNYIQVKKIDGSSSNFRLHVAVLENIFKNQSGQPASSGIFKVKDGELVVLPLTAISHQAKPRKVGKDSFEIWPKKGEIWAMKKNGDSKECDIVEVINGNNKSVKVVILKEQKNHFFAAPKGTRSVSMDIKRKEFVERFSHQCLAYHMGEEDSRLKGYWQLDPSSIPGSVIVLD